MSFLCLLVLSLDKKKSIQNLVGFFKLNSFESNGGRTFLDIRTNEMIAEYVRGFHW